MKRRAEFRRQLIETSIRILTRHYEDYPEDLQRDLNSEFGELFRPYLDRDPTNDSTDEDDPESTREDDSESSGEDDDSESAS